MEGKTEVVAYLITCRSPSISDLRRLLKVAGKRNYTEIFEILFGRYIQRRSEVGPDFRKDLEVFLRRACKPNSNPKMVKTMLDRSKDLVNKDTTSALYQAAFNGNVDLVRYLLTERKATPNKVVGDRTLLQTLLAGASVPGRLPAKNWRKYTVEIAHMLLEAGAQVNLTFPGGPVPLVHAAWLNNKKLVALFIQYGADVELFFCHLKHRHDKYMGEHKVKVLDLLLSSWHPKTTTPEWASTTSADILSLLRAGKTSRFGGGTEKEVHFAYRVTLGRAEKWETLLPGKSTAWTAGGFGGSTEKVPRARSTSSLSPDLTLARGRRRRVRTILSFSG